MDANAGLTTQLRDFGRCCWLKNEQVHGAGDRGRTIVFINSRSHAWAYVCNRLFECGGECAFSGWNTAQLVPYSRVEFRGDAPKERAMKLTTEQVRAINHPNGKLQLIACAGSG